ncbi:MAG: hypothetical protein QUS09_02565 [Methanotrichaceae archaeon]|nr:hypothetical protein [Methanotrichaceae archaeon]
MLSKALAEQDLSVLYEIRDMVDSLISERKPSRGGEDRSRREVLDVKKAGTTITYRLERVSCGKGCKGCPHGPYWYGYWKEGGKTRSKYIGKRLVEP